MALFDDTFPPYIPFGSRELSLQFPAKKGTDVAVLQSVYNLMLRTMTGPGTPLGAAVTIDGAYGSQTRQAVRHIQSYFGLAVDGVAGPNTYFVFGQGVGSHTTYGGPVYGSRQLQPGDSGGDVKILQNRLNGFRYASLIGGPADGVFGPKTAQAVLAFKADAEINGDTGFPHNAIAGFGFYDASWLYTFMGGRAIFSGRNGFDTVFLQVILTNLGFFSDDITGFYREETERAVRNFQRSQAITVDGVVGPETFYRLGLQNPEAAPAPLDVAWPPAIIPELVEVCSVALTSQTSDLHPYGAACVVVNQAEGFESLDVTGNLLPNPGDLGPYSTYFFTLTNPSTGLLVLTAPMIPLPTDQDWAGSYSPGVSTIVRGVVAIRPGTTGGAPLGPVVVAGNAANCH
ncbi:MAG: peptidoglycan-binding protein [Thermaerobacter sp.]|nr:peptidoglycan-binding protein [Thermaerobacter sp.]